VTEESRDVVVIGGGPGGASAAGFLALQGVDVLVLEKLSFPRFKIGESLLPYNLPLLDRLGAGEKVRSAGYQVKRGALFFSGEFGGRRLVDFSHGWDEDHAFAYQVPRAEFDSLLLEHARGCGADVRHRMDVRRVILEGGAAVGVEVAGPDGAARRIRSRVVIDASGGAAALAGALGMRRPYPKMRRAALFAHYEGAPTHAEARAGDILLPIHEKVWYWQIPFSDGRSSVGAVFEPELARGRAADREALFDGLLAECPELSPLLRSARRISPVYGASDYSWRARRLAGNGWALVGDAAGFLDPTFSSGVFLAMTMGEKAATRIAGALRRPGPVRRAQLRAYERESLRVLNAFRRYVEAFYSPFFMKTFCTEAPNDHLLRAVTTVLSGGYEQMPAAARFWNRLFFFSYRIDRFFSSRVASGGPP
jgi:flavin-dependent dehydrogenase